MHTIDADLSGARSSKSNLSEQNKELSQLIKNINSKIEELRPYLKGTTTESSYGKLDVNVKELINLESYISNTIGMQKSIIGKIKNMMDDISHK